MPEPAQGCEYVVRGDEYPMPKKAKKPQPCGQAGKLYELGGLMRLRLCSLHVGRVLAQHDGLKLTEIVQ